MAKKTCLSWPKTSIRSRIGPRVSIALSGEPPEREPGTGFVNVRIPVLAQTQQKGLSDSI